MRRAVLLENPIRAYAWGSRTAIAELRGEAVPSAGPQAELWMGAHPSAPSQALLDGRRISLAELVAKHPEEILGPRVAARFGPRLPFLAKLLAAAAPLSLQAHPDAAQARAGFARESALGIPPDSEQRSYRDASHKPELLCALAPFEALCGFRAPDAIRERAARLAVPALGRRVAAALASETPLAELLAGLLRLDRERRRALVAAAAAAAAGSADPGLAWIPRLARAYPDDAGALAPLFLEHVRLEPGEALHLPAGELHGYLGGFAVEVMASSDNVLRGGLTSKHVDADELLRILRFEAREPAKLRPRADGVYATPAQEFELARIEVGAGGFASADERGVELLVCTAGALRVRTQQGALELPRGQSCLVPASARGYALDGAGVVHRVGVPA